MAEENLREFCRDLLQANRQIERAERRKVEGHLYIYSIEIIANRRYDEKDVLIERDIREVQAATWWEAIHKIDPKLKRDDVIFTFKRRID